MAHLYAEPYPIVIQESAGYNRIREPVTFGYPFSRGQVFHLEGFQVQNGSGQQIDAQFSSMALWPDSSLKWVQCDFQVDVDSNQTCGYTLQTSGGGQTVTELSVDENAECIYVSTGPMQFLIRKSRFRLLDQVWLDINKDGQFSDSEVCFDTSQTSWGPVVKIGGQAYWAEDGLLQEIVVEEQGPMKVVIRASGLHDAGNSIHMKYETRIYACAGQSHLKIYHVYANNHTTESLGNTLDASLVNEIDSYRLYFPVISDSVSVLQTGMGSSIYHCPLSYNDTIRLRQKDKSLAQDPFSFDILQNNTPVFSGERSEGWGSLTGTEKGVALGCRYFWQKYPKGLAFSSAGISIDLVASSQSFYVGMGSGDEVILSFFQSPDSVAAISKVKAMILKPLLPRADSRQFEQSGVFYPLSKEGISDYPGMSAYIETVTANHLANRESMQAYENLHFGDVPRDAYETDEQLEQFGWGNNYYDCVLTSARLFALTGDLRYVDIMVPMARHFMETDCFNTHASDWLNGFCGAYGPFHRNTGHFEHHYGEGIWYYYYLTGDKRARDIGLRAAGSIMNEQTWGNENVGCRTAYQRGSACLEAYKNTYDSDYLNHAEHLLVDKLLATQDAYGVIGTSMEEGGFHTEGEQTFMIALYSDALWKFIQEVTEDASKDSLIHKFGLLADYVHQYARKSAAVEEYWNILPEPGSVYSPCPDTADYYGDETVYWNGKGLIAGLYAYAYSLTSDEKYKSYAQSILKNMWQSPDAFGQEFWGKAACQAMKNSLHAVAIVHAMDSTGFCHKLDGPQEFQLYPCYPNPFNQSSVISYSVTDPGGQFTEENRGKVEIRIYDVLGRQVLSDELKPEGAGMHQYVVDASGWSTGIYYYVVQTERFKGVGKMVYLR